LKFGVERCSNVFPGPDYRYPGPLRGGAKRHFLTALVFAAVAPVFADPADQLLSEDEFLGEVPVVLSATRLEQPEWEVPSAVTVIDREMIRASGARDVADLFRLVPGMQVGYQYGHRPVVTYHGLSDQGSRRMQVLVDGRSIYSPFFGGVFWIDQPLAIEDIERIEVIRSPNSASYGANSFLGTISIITQHAAQAEGTLLSLRAGSDEIRDGVARHGWSHGEQDFRVTLRNDEDDGFDNRNDGREVAQATFRGDLRFGARDTLDLQLGFNSGEWDLGEPGEIEPPHDRDSTTHYQQLRWRRALAGDEELSVHFYHNYWEAKNNFRTPPLDFSWFKDLGVIRVPVDYDVEDDRYDLELQHTFSPAGDWRIVWGAGARLDRVRSEGYFNKSGWINNEVYRLFGEAAWRIRPDLTINAGGTLEHNDINGTDLSPRLSVNYRLTPQHSLRAAVSRAVRSPRILEEQADLTTSYDGVLVDNIWTSEGGLDAETITSFEIGYLGEIPQWGLSWNIRVYKDDLDDLITSPFVSTINGKPLDDWNQVTQNFKNTASVDLKGGEIEVEYSPNRRTRLMLSHAVMDASASDPSASSAKKLEESVPDHTSSLMLIYRLTEYLQASAAYSRVGEMDWLGSGDFVDDYDRLDVTLSTDFSIGETQGQFDVTYQNWGGDYVEFRQENIFDHRAYATLRLNF
jgi:iron complex outermembrane receptor protein